MNAIFTILTLITTGLTVQQYLTEDWGYFFLWLATSLGILTVWITMGVKSKKLNDPN